MIAIEIMLGIGIIALLIPFVAVFFCKKAGKLRFFQSAVTFASMLLCAVVILLTFMDTRYLVSMEHYGTLEDLINGYAFGSIALLVCTGLFNIIFILVSSIVGKKKQ